MATERELLSIIKRKKKIIFICRNKTGHPDGRREGLPHALFFNKNGKKMLYVWKINGVQKNENWKLPGWRQYFMADLVIIKALDSFTPQPDFNTASFDALIASV